MSLQYHDEYSIFINNLADEARKITLKYFRTNLTVDEKDDLSPVTIADREIELSLRSMIIKKYPSHGIIGEEFENHNEGAEFVWVIDPIDGTRAFMTGKPLFGTIIGLMNQGIPKYGLVDQGFTDERWFGISNTLATHNGKAIKVAVPRKIDKSRMYLGSPNMFDGPILKSYWELCRATLYPQYGADCYAYGLLAMGFADIVVEQKLKLHDVAGIAPIITGAGGYIAEWDGRSIGASFKGQVVAASHRELAEQATSYFRL